MWPTYKTAGVEVVEGVDFFQRLSILHLSWRRVFFAKEVGDSVCLRLMAESKGVCLRHSFY